MNQDIEQRDADRDIVYACATPYPGSSVIQELGLIKASSSGKVLDVKGFADEDSSTLASQSPSISTFIDGCDVVCHGADTASALLGLAPSADVRVANTKAMTEKALPTRSEQDALYGILGVSDNASAIAGAKGCMKLFVYLNTYLGVNTDDEWELGSPKIPVSHDEESFANQPTQEFEPVFAEDVDEDVVVSPSVEYAANDSELIEQPVQEESLSESQTDADEVGEESPTTEWSSFANVGATTVPTSFGMKAAPRLQEDVPVSEEENLVYATPITFFDEDEIEDDNTFQEAPVLQEEAEDIAADEEPLFAEEVVDETELEEDVSDSTVQWDDGHSQIASFEENFAKSDFDMDTFSDAAETEYKDLKEDSSIFDWDSLSDIIDDSDDFEDIDFFEESPVSPTSHVSESSSDVPEHVDEKHEELPRENLLVEKVGETEVEEVISSADDIYEVFEDEHPVESPLADKDKETEEYDSGFFSSLTDDLPKFQAPETIKEQASAFAQKLPVVPDIFSDDDNEEEAVRSDENIPTIHAVDDEESNEEAPFSDEDILSAPSFAEEDFESSNTFEEQEADEEKEPPATAATDIAHEEPAAALTGWRSATTVADVHSTPPTEQESEDVDELPEIVSAPVSDTVSETPSSFYEPEDIDEDENIVADESGNNEERADEGENDEDVFASDEFEEEVEEEGAEEVEEAALAISEPEQEVVLTSNGSEEETDSPALGWKAASAAVALPVIATPIAAIAATEVKEGDETPEPEYAAQPIENISEKEMEEGLAKLPCEERVTEKEDGTAEVSESLSSDEKTSVVNDIDNESIVRMEKLFADFQKMADEKLQALDDILNRSIESFQVSIDKLSESVEKAQLAAPATKKSSRKPAARNLPTTRTIPEQPSDDELVPLSDLPTQTEFGVEDVNMDGEIVYSLAGTFKHSPKGQQPIKDYFASKGAKFSKDVTLNCDYLILGQLGSNLWKDGDYGSKVQKALELQESGKSAIRIVDEDSVIGDDFWE